MTVANITVSETPLVLYILRRADDALILGHRLSEWCGHAPMLEEDMALANMGLDLIGQARELYSYAAKVEGRGNDEDKFAYLRDVRQYRNLLLAGAAERRFRPHHGAAVLLRGLRRSLLARDDALDATRRWPRSRRSRKRKAPIICAIPSEWIDPPRRRHRGKPRRAQAAIDELWAYTGEMFAVDDSERGLIDAGIAIDPATVACAMAEDDYRRARRGDAGACRKSDWMQQGGRSGRHSEHLGHLLSELQSMPRTFPGATW